MTSRDPASSAAGGVQEAGGLQSKVGTGADPEPVGHLSSVLWHSRHVCRIDLESTDGLMAKGTGFLVGPDLVLTNYHVVEGRPPEEIKCRFDYRHKGQSAKEFGYTVSVDEILKSSVYSPAERDGKYSSDSTAHPDATTIDYALLKISKKVGWLPFVSRDGVGIRGWICLPKEKSRTHPESLVYILQHPKGSPVAHASGRMADAQPTDARVRYLTTTDLGSSGSPCFRFLANGSSEPQVVALHNYGDPGWGAGNLPAFNHGIPVHLIAEDLQRGGVKLPSQPPKNRTVAAAGAALVALALIGYEHSCCVGIACPNIVEPATYVWFSRLITPFKTLAPQSF